ncbi:leucine-rich repeat domain-containing protein [Eubacterium xylanophilum]|uniref:leucine-rich repeat domain-containing protein n=1 Tax=Eubacterium xylanophilum TaxID=39497 RepID=UPI00047D23F7|nr:leucine-rich repeat domain-containing protein [Eubacterium xylanophilum]
MKKILLTMLLLAAFAVLCSSTVMAKERKINYKVKNGVLTITGKSAMPNYINFGKKKSTKNIKKVIIKKGVTSISSNCFENCKKLKSVKLPNTLFKIGDFAFRNTAIKKITIPKSVYYIGYMAFGKCKNLKEITTPSYACSYGSDEDEISDTVADKVIFTTPIKSTRSISFSLFFTKNYVVCKKDKKYSSHYGDIYSKDGKKLIHISRYKDSFKLYSKCETICANAFVNNVGDECYESCNKIKNITIPGTVKHVLGEVTEGWFPNTVFDINTSNMGTDDVCRLCMLIGIENAEKYLSKDVKREGNVLNVREKKLYLDEAYDTLLFDDPAKDKSKPSVESGTSEAKSYVNPTKIDVSLTTIDVTDTENDGCYWFNEEMAGKRVDINAKREGILVFYSDEKIKLYDANNKLINYYPYVKAGDRVFLQLPSKMKTGNAVKYIHIQDIYKKSANVDTPNREVFKVATGKNQYVNFSLKYRTNLGVSIIDYKNIGNAKLSFVIQKKTGNKWKNYSSTRKLINGNIISDKKWITTGCYEREFQTNLDSGNYRLKIKAKKGSIYEINLSDNNLSALAPVKISNKKKNAPELFDYDYEIDGNGVADFYRRGIFTKTNGMNHWYKFTKDIIANGRIQVEIHGASTGKYEVSLYKKGSSKKLRTKYIDPGKILKNPKEWWDNGVVNFRVKKKGVYYVKIHRFNKKSTASYTCSFQYLQPRIIYN